MAKLQAEELDTTTDEEKIMSMWQIENPDDPCSSASLNIQSNCVNIQPEELGNDDDYDIDF